MPKQESKGAPEKAIRRLCTYRRLLLLSHKEENVYSYEIAKLAGVSAAQVRRDLMLIGYEGSSNKGYEKQGLLDAMGDYLDHPEGQRLALVGIGGLGRSLLQYFAGTRPKLKIVAAFDVDETRVGRVIHGCRCHHLSKLEEIVQEEDITIGVIAVPSKGAQEVANLLVRAGVKGIINFAYASLQVPEDVYVSTIDITTTFETVAFFSRWE